MQRRSIQAGTMYVFREYQGSSTPNPVLAVDGGNLWSVKGGAWFLSKATRYESGDWRSPTSGVLVVQRKNYGVSLDEIDEKMRAVVLPQEITPETVRDLARSLDGDLKLDLVNPVKIDGQHADWATYREGARIADAKVADQAAKQQRMEERQADLMAKIQEKAVLDPFARVSGGGMVKISLPFLAQLLGIDTDMIASERLTSPSVLEEAAETSYAQVAVEGFKRGDVVRAHPVLSELAGTDVGKRDIRLRLDQAPRRVDDRVAELTDPDGDVVMVYAETMELEDNQERSEGELRRDPIPVVVKPGDLVEGVLSSSYPPRTVWVRVDRAPWTVSRRGATLVGGGDGFVGVVITKTIRIVDPMAPVLWCGQRYGTDDLGVLNGAAMCERRAGHPGLSTDGIGHWGSRDRRHEENPDRVALDGMRRVRPEDVRVGDLVQGVTEGDVVPRPVRVRVTQLVTQNGPDTVYLAGDGRRVKVLAGALHVVDEV